MLTPIFIPQIPKSRVGREDAINHPLIKKYYYTLVTIWTRVAHAVHSCTIRIASQLQLLFLPYALAAAVNLCKLE